MGQILLIPLIPVIWGIQASLLTMNHWDELSKCQWEFSHYFFMIWTILSALIFCFSFYLLPLCCLCVYCTPKHVDSYKNTTYEGNTEVRHYTREVRSDSYIAQ